LRRGIKWLRQPAYKSMGEFLNPAEILKKFLKLKEDMVVVDLGCGSGGWAIPLAKRLKDGKVYAVDIQQEPLSSLRAKAQTEKISNIETVWADAEQGTNLVRGSADLVLLTNILFQCNDKRRTLEEAKRIIKKIGRILVIDWNQNAPLGPAEGRVSKEDIKEIVQGIGLKVEKEFEASNFHWGLILKI